VSVGHSPRNIGRPALRYSLVDFRIDILAVAEEE